MGVTAFVNGHVFTGDSFTDSFYVKDGYFVKPGLPEKTIDLKGKTVVPGFIDSHLHFLSAGLYALGADLSGTFSLDDVLSRIKTFVEKTALAQPFASRFDETRLKENRFPSLEELDGVTKNTPFYIVRIDLHSMMVNSAFAKKYNMENSSPFIRGKAYDAMVARLAKEVPFEDKRKGLKEMEKAAFRAGVTGVHTMEGVEKDFSGVDAMLSLQKESLLNILLYPQIMDVQGVTDRGLSRIGGCILIDGSLGSRTAALCAPYADAPEEKGRLYLTDEELFCFMDEAHDAGLQMSFHAIGDRAVEQLVRGYARLGREAEKRHRIEHGIVVRDEEYRAIADLGLWINFQPMFHAYWGHPGGLYEQRLDPDRAKRINRIKTAKDLGIPFAFGSDCHVTPLDPLGGIRAAVNHPVPEESLSVEEAVKGFTLYGAQIGHDEKKSGSIALGRRADFVILSENIFDNECLGKAEIEKTYVSGRCLYQRESV